MTDAREFDIDADCPPSGGQVAGEIQTPGMLKALPARTWEFTIHGWTSYDGSGRPELVARAFTPAGQAVTRLWLASLPEVSDAG